MAPSEKPRDMFSERKAREILLRKCVRERERDRESERERERERDREIEKEIIVNMK